MKTYFRTILSIFLFTASLNALSAVFPSPTPVHPAIANSLSGENLKLELIPDTLFPESRFWIKITPHSTVKRHSIRWITIEIPEIGFSFQFTRNALNAGTNQLLQQISGLEPDRNYTVSAGLTTVAEAADPFYQYNINCDPREKITAGFKTGKPASHIANVLLVVDKEFENDNDFAEALHRYELDAKRANKTIHFDRYYISPSKEEQVALLDTIGKLRKVKSTALTHLFFLGNNAAMKYCFIPVALKGGPGSPICSTDFSLYSKAGQLDYFQETAPISTFIQYQQPCNQPFYHLEKSLRASAFSNISQGILAPPENSLEAKKAYILGYLAKLHAYKTGAVTIDALLELYTGSPIRNFLHETRYLSDVVRYSGAFKKSENLFGDPLLLLNASSSCATATLAFTTPAEIRLCETPEADLKVTPGYDAYRWFFEGRLLAATDTSSLTVRQPGTYTVEATGCDRIATGTGTTRVTFTPVKPVITLENGTLKSNNPSGNQWQLNGADLPGATGPVMENPGTGAYTVRITKDHCAAVSEPFLVTARSETDAPTLVYPNPSNKGFHIKLPSEWPYATVQLRDLHGKTLRETTFSNNGLLYTLEGIYPPGTYLLTLSCPGKTPVTRRVVVE